jgi:alkyl sulfatase BDS1-like metallo-beta-lactamase superfamily hydrolase
MRNIAAWSAIALLVQAPAWAADKSSPYNGGEAVEHMRLPNGAIVNAQLAKDPFLKTDPRLIEVRSGVWTVTGYALSNCSFVETDAGIVVFDAGSNIGQGAYFLNQIRKVSKKPVIAIIYSHTHYTGGAKALAEGRDIPIYAHANLTANQRNRTLDRAPSHVRRANMQFGGYLPRTGDDAAVTTPEPQFADPTLKQSGFLPVTHPVADGEEIAIGGTRFLFKWAQADTTDSLTVWIPELGTVLTNSVTNMFYPLYTLRGEEYRNPMAIVRGYDDVRALAADYYVPVHGDPVVGRVAIEGRLTLHRDAYAFVYNQAVRGINRGWSPDEIVQRTRLPQRFLDEPTLNQVYSEFDYALRGVYRGLIGWYAEDTAALNPPGPGRLGQSIVAGFGGMEPLVAASRAALARGEYDLAASLAGYGVDADPENGEARQAKADALRQLARASRGFQSYNFYLTEAVDLEGKVDRFAAPPVADIGNTPPAVIARSAAIDLVRVLESRIDPVATSGVTQRMALRFDGEDAPFSVIVRDGVAEVRSGEEPVDLAVRVARMDWAGFLQGRVTPAELLRSGKVKVERGTAADAQRFLQWFAIPRMVPDR